MDSSILIDQSQMNPRKVSLAVNEVADAAGGGFAMRSRHMSLDSYSSLPSLSQLLPNHHHAFSSRAAAGGCFGSYGSHHLQPPPPQLYASLPPSFSTDQAVVGRRHHHHHHPPLPLLQPPLLPLPLTRSVTLPPSPKMARANTAGTGLFRSRDHRMKPKASMKSRKEPQSPAKAGQKTAERVTVCNNEEGKEEEKEVSMETIYSLSPPPSNLPLPNFLLTKHKATAATSNTKVIMGGGGGGGVAGGCGRA